MKRPMASRLEDAGAEIKAMFDSLGISRSRVRLNMPRHLVTVRFLKLPSTDDAEIKKMVKSESLKHVPYADEDVVSGFRIIEKLTDGYSNIMIAVAQAEAVRREADILKRAGMTVESVSLGSETLLLWYLGAYQADSDISVLLVNIDSGHIDIDVISNGMLLFTRGASYSDSSPISVEKIIDQVNVSLAAYKKESLKHVDKVVISGMQGQADELKAALKERMKIPVEVVSQMEKVPVHQGASLETEDASFTELLGLALKYEDANINILPEASQEEQRLELVKKNIVTGLIVSALIVVMAFGVVLKKLHDKRAYISYVDSELGKIEPRVRTAKKMAKEIDIVTSRIAERPLAIDLASEIFKITPQGITLTMMEYESNKAMTLRGTASSLSDVFKYVTVLGKSTYFKNVKVRYANKRVSQASELADFEIACVVGAQPALSGAASKRSKR